MWPETPDHPHADIALVLFEEAADGIPPEGASGTYDNNAAVSHLEIELAHTREQLQTVIEQYEAALEEAQSGSEEMQAINEELRSATEELETSKEELQSINEELVTLNAQLKIKVDETSRANDDLQNFVTATGIATLYINRQLRIQRYTRPCTRLFNLIASDVGRPLSDITHRLDYPSLFGDIESVFDTLQSVEREVRSTDGQWYIARLLPYRTAQDHIAGLVLTLIDISRRKAVEEKLYESEQRMRRVTASTRDYAIVSMDREGRVTSWNHGAERVFGYSEAEMAGRSIDILYTYEDRERAVLQEVLRLAQQDGRAEDDRWLMRKDGALIFCSGITTPLAEDGLHGFVKICRDMTGSKWMQDHQSAQLEWEKRERVRAEESARLRDEFFAVLSHELKQPLNLIQLTAEMLSRLPEAAQLPAIGRASHTIKHMVESQARIIDDLMDLSRLHTGKLSLTRTQVNFSEVVSHVVKMMMDDARQKQVALTLESAPMELFVLGDAVRLEQIVWNLLSNALKFTSAGGSVRVSLMQEAESVWLDVADTGKGIDPQHLPFIFEMFRQADSGTTRQYGGMGIGLALVKELVHSHGGLVEAHSEGAGQGARFRVLLPLVVSAQAVAEPAHDKRDLTGKRILLIEDAIDTLESLTALLQLQGANVSSAPGSATALAIAQEAGEPFDLIISDIGLPGMDGYTLLPELRKQSATSATPAIALSGFTRPKDVDHALAAGFEVHVRKPVEFDDFLALVQRVSR